MCIPRIMEIHMDKKMGNDMETGDLCRCILLIRKKDA